MSKDVEYWINDAKDYGEALATASRVFLDVYKEIMGAPCPGALFNDSKKIVRRVIIAYAEEVAARQADAIKT